MIFGENWEYTWLYLQQNRATCEVELIQRRYFKFLNEVKYFCISTMQQLKYRESRRLCDGN